MGLFDKLRNEFVDIIEWIDDDRFTLVWRFPRYQNEIKQGAQLIVRPGQMAVFVHRGQLADVFEPGNYELKTDNLPILSTIAGWKYGFNSPFRSEVYFVSTRQVTELKWGTPNPIMLRDPDFGPIRLRAFGTYALKVVDPKALLKELVGTDSVVSSDEINELMRSTILSAFADMLGTQKIAALDLAANYRSMGDALRKMVVERVDDEYGLDVPMLNIVNISLPEEVEKAIDTRSSIGVIGDLGRYQQFQMGKAITMAAENPNGGAGAGVGLGMGFGMANQMANQMGGAFARPGAAPGGPVAPPPPPPPPGDAWHIAISGQTHGPFSAAQIAEGLSLGQIEKSTPVWRDGMAGWQPLSDVPQLAQRTPPPPPPAPPVPPPPPK